MTQHENNGNGSRRTLTASQVGALRARINAYQDALARQLPGRRPRAGTAAMLYLMSLILEAEATRDGEPQHALAQRRVALDKLRLRLGQAPTVEDIESHLQAAEPFDAELRDFLRADLAPGPEG